MTKVSTEQYVRQIDHALEGMETGDKWRSEEIANIRASLHLAIREFGEKSPEAEVFAKETIGLLRDRVDALARDPKSAGNHECYKVILPPVDAAADTERAPSLEKWKAPTITKKK